ncbi:MAG: hypothetical protein AAF289_22070, partial [Cyanobacteria bacterium P01_A01_bin.135]
FLNFLPINILGINRHRSDFFFCLENLLIESQISKHPNFYRPTQFSPEAAGESPAAAAGVVAGRI